MLPGYITLTNLDGKRVVLPCLRIGPIEELAQCNLHGGEVCPQRTKVKCDGDWFLVKETAGVIARKIREEDRAAAE